MVGDGVLGGHGVVGKERRGNCGRVAIEGIVEEKRRRRRRGGEVIVGWLDWMGKYLKSMTNCAPIR